MNPAPVPADALHRAIADLQSIHIALLALADRTDGDWRRELIGLRRRLQQQIQTIAGLLDALPLPQEDAVRLRAAFSRMRSGVALHQANWPAVAIDRADPAYPDSLRAVRAANRDFVSLVATILPPLHQP